MRATTTLTTSAPDHRPSSHQPFLVRTATAPVLKRRPAPATASAGSAATHNYRSMAAKEEASAPKQQRILAIRHMDTPRKLSPSPLPRGAEQAQQPHRSMQVPDLPPTLPPTMSSRDPDLVFPVLNLPNSHGGIAVKQEDDDAEMDDGEDEGEDTIMRPAGEVAPISYDDEYIQSASRECTPDLELDRRIRAASPGEDDECVVMYSRECSPEVAFRREDSAPPVDEGTDFLRNISPTWFRSQSPEEARSITPAVPPATSEQTTPRALRETSHNPRDRREREMSPSDSYDMLQSYGPLNPADKMRQVAEVRKENHQPEAFRPNAGLERRITPSFIRGYGTDNYSSTGTTQTNNSNPSNKAHSTKQESGTMMRRNTSTWSSRTTDETVEESGIPDYFVDEKPWGNNSEFLTLPPLLLLYFCTPSSPVIQFLVARTKY
jgi:hypothetical protein